MTGCGGQWRTTACLEGKAAHWQLDDLWAKFIYFGSRHHRSCLQVARKDANYPTEPERCPSSLARALQKGAVSCTQCQSTCAGNECGLRSIHQRPTGPGGRRRARPVAAAARQRLAGARRGESSSCGRLLLACCLAVLSRRSSPLCQHLPETGGGAGSVPSQRLAAQGQANPPWQQLPRRQALQPLRPLVGAGQHRCDLQGNVQLKGAAGQVLWGATLACRAPGVACLPACPLASRRATAPLPIPAPLLHPLPTACSDTYYVAHVKEACAFLGDGMSKISQLEEQVCAWMCSRVCGVGVGGICVHVFACLWGWGGE